MNDLAKYYQVLELAPGASLEEIDRAYKDLVFVWHPDRLPSDNQRLQDKAQAKLKAINEAREKLRSHRSHSHRSSTARSPANGSYSNRYNSASGQGDHRPKYGYYSPNGYYDPSKGSRPRQPQTARSAPAGESNGTSQHSRSQPAASNTPRQYYRYYSPNRNAEATAKNRDRPTAASQTRQQPQARVPSDRRSHPPRTYNSKPDLDGADLSGMDLKEKDLSGRNLSRADLSRADLSDGFLHRINLEGANLHKAKLFRANLLEANLKNANLQEANLVGADLSGADLSGADLTGAKVGSGNKWFVKMTGTILTDATLPDGKKFEK